jgi:hypothetical protein
VAAVPFEIELAIDCLIDRLNNLAQRLEQAGADALGLSFARLTRLP